MQPQPGCSELGSDGPAADFYFRRWEAGEDSALDFRLHDNRGSSTAMATALIRMLLWSVLLRSWIERTASVWTNEGPQPPVLNSSFSASFDTCFFFVLIFFSHCPPPLLRQPAWRDNSSYFILFLYMGLNSQRYAASLVSEVEAFRGKWMWRNANAALEEREEHLEIQNKVTASHLLSSEFQSF